MSNAIKEHAQAMADRDALAALLKEALRLLEQSNLGYDDDAQRVAYDGNMILDRLGR